MDRMQEFIKNLDSLLSVLYEENEALLNNNGHVVAELVENKRELIEKLEKFKGLNIPNNEKAMSLIREIDSVQETNLLLTKQALSYQEVLLESVAKNINNVTNTYSQKGGYDKANSINLVNQSV